MLISVKGTSKNQLEPGQGSNGDAPEVSHCSLLRNPYQNWPMCWSIVVKDKPAVCPPFLGAFPSVYIPKATKDVNVYFPIYSNNSCELHQWFPGTFWSQYIHYFVSKHYIFKCYHMLYPRGSYIETVLGRESAELAVIHEGSMVPEELWNTILQWGKIQIFICEVRQTASQLDFFFSYGSHLENQLCQTHNINMMFIYHNEELHNNTHYKDILSVFKCADS